MFGMGWQELAFIFVIVLVIFGPKSLPKIGQALGRGIREFKDAAQGLTADLDDDDKPARPKTAPAPQVQQDAGRTVDEDLNTERSSHTV